MQKQAPRPHGPFSLKVVGWSGASGNLQLNLVCTNCNCVFYAQYPYEWQNMLKGAYCPEFVMDFQPLKDSGALDIHTLFDELEKRRQL